MMLLQLTKKQSGQEKTEKFQISKTLTLELFQDECSDIIFRFEIVQIVYSHFDYTSLYFLFM